MIEGMLWKMLIQWRIQIAHMIHAREREIGAVHQRAIIER